jgi:predicted DNA-binding protein with PD1-like motif
MRYSTATLGRVLVIRLEDGDIVHHAIEDAARAEGLARAAVLLVGAADSGSRIVAGPSDPAAAAIVPIQRILTGVNEVAGVGTIFPGPDGMPLLHLHAAFGRDDAVLAGCIRRGVKTWMVAEAIVIELTGSTASRRFDGEMKADLLEP